MDDDIDIEEHDLLEDPRLHDIFPDISQIKVERVDYDYEDQSMECDPYEAYDGTESHDGAENQERVENHVRMGNRDEAQNQEGAENHGESAEYTRYSNRIVLGTKPTAPATKVRKKVDDNNCSAFEANTVNIKQEPQDDDMTENIPEDIDENSQASSVIIVGSKPCNAGVREPVKDTTTAIIESEPVRDSENAQSEVNLDVNIPTDIQMEQSSRDIEEGDVIQDSVVLLENWGPRLLNSSCYCKDCEILFPTTNTLHAHNNVAHSLLVVVDNNKAIKSTARKQAQVMTNGKFCNHCNTIFPNSDSLINHLYENMTVNKNSQTFKTPSKPTTSTPKANVKHSSFNKSFEAKTPINTVPTPKIIENKPDSETNVSHKYKCTLCSEIFLNYNQARSHRVTKHLEMGGHNILKKITFSAKNTSVGNNTVPIPVAVPRNTGQIPPKSPVPTVSKIQENSPSKLPQGISEALVPLSILFKCYKCAIHFTACYPAMQHVKKCLKKKGEWICELCQKQFKSWARVMHNLQHKYSQKFTVYTVNEHIFGKVMNKCPDCNTYLYEKDFLTHRNSGQPCEKKRVFKCGTCTLPVHYSSAKEHINWHDTFDMGFNDMILVNFQKIDQVKVATGPVKRQLQIDEAPENKKTKIGTEDSQTNKMTVFYCSTCNTCLFNSRTKDFHFSGRCESIGSQRTICKTCGLVCHTSHGYNKACQRVKGNLMQMTFRSIQENKPICPPIPKYPNCNKCQVHFCSQKSVVSHDCKESHKTCKFCMQKFSDLAYKLHVRYHLFMKQFASSAVVEPSNFPRPAKVNVSKAPKAPKNATMPDILKKYQMLTSGLHILYLCELCDVACDIYDSAVEHSQKHYNKMENYDVILNPCNVCGLKFDSTCYDRHIYLHDQDKSINKNSFNIVKYNFKYLFSKPWSNILSDLPEAQAKRIFDTSIYKYGKSIKLRVVEEGPPEATIYICRKCNKVISPVMLTCHLRSLACNETDNRFKCRHCGRGMATIKTKVKHEKIHENYSEFRIVYFNEDGDEEFNKTLQKHDVLRMASKGYTFFKCEQCQCILGPSNKLSHRCLPSEKLIRCGKCQLCFHYRAIKRHLKLHSLYPNFSRKNIKLTPFKPILTAPSKKSAPSKPLILSERPKPVTRYTYSDADLYKCKCGLHFTNRKSAEKHLPLCKNETSEKSKEKCSKCGLLFDTTQLVAHLCKHHSNDNENNTKFKVFQLREYCEVNCNGYILHKCLKCNIHFTSATNIKRHIQKHPKQTTLACPHCKLIFRPKTLKKHIATHHNNSVKPVKNIKGPTVKTVIPKPSFKLKPSTGMKIMKQQNVNAKIVKKRYGKFLYRCNECKNPTFFLCALALRSHILRKRHDTATEKCDLCHYSFVSAGSSLKMHMEFHHKKMKLKRRDFIIKVPGRTTRDVVSATSEEASQISTDDETEPVRNETPVQPPKPRAIAKKSTTKSIVPYAATNKNANKSMEIDVPSDKDNEDENKRNALSSMDDDGRRKYNFFNVLFKCEICGIHVLTGSKVRPHIMEAHVKSVPSVAELCYCGLIFSKWLISRHKQMHHEKLNLTAADLYVVPVNRYEDVNGQVIVGHKYLFRCSICKLNHMHLNRLEDHLAEVEHYTGNCRCPKCHLAFLPGTLPGHIALHHDILDMSPEDYVVMESVGNDCIALLKETTNQIMTPATERSSSTATTISSVEHLRSKTPPKILSLNSRTVIPDNISEDKKKMIKQLTMTSIQRAATEYLKYIQKKQIHEKELRPSKSILKMYKKNLFKCYNCEIHYLHSAFLKEHVRQKACKQESIVCLICDLKFAPNTLCRHVKFQHKLLKFTRDDFVITDSRVCCDNDSSIVSDTGGSQEESENDDISGLSKDDSVSTVSKEDVAKLFYQCTKCLCNFLHRKTLKIHSAQCDGKSNIFECPVCELRFTKITLTKHLTIDHGNISVTKTQSQRDKMSPLIKERSDVKMSAQSDVKTSAQSDVAIDTQQYLSRFSLNDDLYSDLKPEYFRCDLFKCNFCCLHYLTAKNLRRHLKYYKYAAHVVSEIDTCKLCELKFTKKILPQHVYIHHFKLKVSKDDYRIINNDDDLYKSILSGKYEVESEAIDKTGEEPLTDTSMNPYNNASINDSSVVHDDSISEYADEPKEISEKISTLNADLYSNKLFRCSICELHFIMPESLKWHIEKGQHGIQKTHCTTCGLAFTVKTLPTHVYIHHEKLKLMREHYHIIHNSTGDETSASKEGTIENTTMTLEKNENSSACPNLRNLEETANSKQLQTSASGNDNIDLSIDDTENQRSTLEDVLLCEIADSADSTDVLPEPAKDTKETSSSSPENMKSSENNEKLIKLYKCADCNVCFLNQTICYKHVVKHTPLDAKDYIECKLCGYQFMIINSLHKHIWKHHNRVFKPEDVLIEEYHPNILVHDTPKIEIYYGSDKVQSKLVSTTSEGTVTVTSSEANDDSTITETVNEEVRIENHVEEVVEKSIETPKNIENIAPDVVDELNSNMDVDLTNANIIFDE